MNTTTNGNEGEKPSLPESRPGQFSVHLGDCRRLPPAIGIIIESQQTAITQTRRLEFYHYDDMDLASIRQVP